MNIKGQMVYCPESQCLLFLGSPVIKGLSGLVGKGLYISDIPVHDATRDIMLVEEQTRAQDGLKKRMDKLKNSIQEASQAVEEERQKNVDLLHLIFPAEIARKLWRGNFFFFLKYLNLIFVSCSFSVSCIFNFFKMLLVFRHFENH